ncbi:MAG TPA: hypothetical protein VNA67_07750 [Pseudonocardiaceae bacterium]|nr:hypothetical protein [Pseudonocardiaceae bacterium]
MSCAAAALALPPETVITGRSAAGLRGVQLARARDCVHVVVPDSTRIARRAGLDVRRTLVKANECTPWIEDSRGRLARADLAFQEHKVAVEHDAPGATASCGRSIGTGIDLNRVQAAGWEIVLVTAQLLHDPARMVQTVHAALDRRRR